VNSMTVEVKKCLGQIIWWAKLESWERQCERLLMYRHTTTVFAHTVSWNCLETMRQAWHFIGNSKLKYVSSRLFRIQPVYECLFQKFRSLYRPEEELLPNKKLILWRGCQKFQSYNAGKSKKFGILVWMLCEAKAGCISNMEILIAEWKMLK
jgi:hypothetical protein